MELHHMVLLLLLLLLLPFHSSYYLLSFRMGGLYTYHFPYIQPTSFGLGPFYFAQHPTVNRSS